MRFAILMACVSICVSITVSKPTDARADWLNPTRLGDCQAGVSSVQSQLFAVQRQAHQCFRDTYPSPGNGPGEFGAICGDPPRTNVPACASLEQRACRLETEAKRRQTICHQRLSAHREQEAAKHAQQREQERLQRERERIARDNDTLIGPGERIIQPSDQPALLSDGGRIAGHGMARLLGTPMTGQAGAYSLSTSMGIVGNRILTGLNEAALGDLEGALRRFNADNPRPTAVRLEAFLAERADLASTYATHVTRVRNTDHRLPLGDRSAVTGPAAGTVAQLIRMRISGELDTPIAGLGAAAVTRLADQAYRLADDRIANQAGSDAPQAEPARQLREMRQAILTPLTQEREEIARATSVVTPKPEPASPAQSDLPANPLACFKRMSETGVRNLCSVTVYCRNASGVVAEFIPASIAVRYLTRVENGFPIGNAPNGRMVFMGGTFMAYENDLNDCSYSRISDNIDMAPPAPAPRGQTAQEAFQNLHGSPPRPSTGGAIQ